MLSKDLFWVVQHLFQACIIIGSVLIRSIA